jgi:amino acid permease
MITKYLLIGALLGGLILFFWGFVTHSLIAENLVKTLHDFTNENAVVEAVRANAPSNGMYMSRYGVLVAVNTAPDPADSSQLLDRTADITSHLVREFLSSALCASLLAAALAWARTTSVLGGASLLALVALAAWTGGAVSLWNWYGFSAPFIAVDALDSVGGWFFAGLALGALKKKFSA